MRSSSVAVRSPQTPAQAMRLVRRIQELTIQIEEIETELEKQMGELAEDAQEKTAPLLAERTRLEAALERYASAHRDEILIGKARSVRVPCGRYGWQLGNVCVQFAEDDDDALVAELEKRGLDKYVTIKKVPNRNLMKQDREFLEEQKIPGLSFEQPERFYVKIDKPTASSDQPKKREAALTPS